MVLACATSDVDDRLISIANIRDVLNKLLKISKERMATRLARSVPIFFSRKILFIFRRRSPVESSDTVLGDSRRPRKLREAPLLSRGERWKLL